MKLKTMKLTYFEAALVALNRLGADLKPSQLKRSLTQIERKLKGKKS